MTLIDADISLRPRGPRDAFELDWSGDEEAARFGQDLEGSPWSQMWDRRRRQAFWVLVGGEVVGEVDLFDIRRGDRTAELRIGIAPGELLGRGYGRRALALVLTYAVEHLKLTSVYLRVRQQNDRAVRCYLAAGFRRSGRLQGARFPEPILLMHCALGTEGVAQRTERRSRRECAVGQATAGEFGV